MTLQRLDKHAVASLSLMAAGLRLPARPMLHLVAALPAEAQNVGSTQGSLAGAESAPDRVINFDFLAVPTTHSLCLLL